MSRAARRHVVGNDVSTLPGFASALGGAPEAAAAADDTEPTEAPPEPAESIDPRTPAWRLRDANEPRPAGWQRWLAATRGWMQSRKKRPAIDPTLPVSAQLVAVQHPSVTLPERPYDLAADRRRARAARHRHDRDLLGDRRRRADAVPRRRALPRAPAACTSRSAASRCGSARGFDYRRLKAWTYPLLADLAAAARRGARHAGEATARSAGSRSAR